MDKEKADQKRHLSKHVMQMKFMQRTASNNNGTNADEQQCVDDEHWVRDLPNATQVSLPFISQPSYVICGNLKTFGRVSYKGFNKEIEKLMKIADQDRDLETAAEIERENTVTEEEMASRYSSLIGTIKKKFNSKRGNTSEDTSDEDSDESNSPTLQKVDVSRPSTSSARKTAKKSASQRTIEKKRHQSDKSAKKKPKFMKPSESSDD